MTTLLEYLEPAFYTCLVLLCNSVAVTALFFKPSKDTAMMARPMYTKFQVIPISGLPCSHDKSSIFIM